MILVMPMAGHGSRFKKMGVTTPKPFIDVKGKWMLEWALKGFDLGKFTSIVFLILKEHEDQFGAQAKLKEKFGGKVRCVIVDRVTEGAACTALLAKEYIDADEDIVVKDSDGWIISRIHEGIEKNRVAGADAARGILSTVNLPGDRWSFARTDERGHVVEVAEKRRISDHAIAGLYYFLHGRDFVKYAERMVAANRRVANGEFYMSTVYQEMIEDGQAVIIDEAEAIWEIGTPESLQYFLDNYKE